MAQLLPLSDNPSKQEEIEYYREFLARLPRNSYLHSYFAGSEGLIENRIRNDFGCEAITEIHSDRERYVKERADAKAQLDEANKQLASVKQSTQELLGQIGWINQMARKLAPDAQNVASRLNDLMEETHNINVGQALANLRKS